MRKLRSRLAASLTLIIGVVWTLEIVLFFQTMAGISTPISSRSLITAAASWFIGPICLTVASMMILIGKLPAISVALATLATLNLNAIIGDMIYDALHPQPLQGPPPFEFYAVVAAVTLLCDLCVLWLIANWKINRGNAGVNTSGA